MSVASSLVYFPSWLSLSLLRESGSTMTLVSVSDVTSTNRWLNIWCIQHTTLETRQEFQSHHLILQSRLDSTEFLGDVCVKFSNVLPGNKSVMTLYFPLLKEGSCHFHSFDNERLWRSAKNWIFQRGSQTINCMAFFNKRWFVFIRDYTFSPH